jgi:hypothetical protein
MSGIEGKHAPARARGVVLVVVCCLAVFFIGAKPPGAGHEHDASDITTGILSDERLSENVTMDDEVISILLDFDGPGSDLDADLLDGKDSTDFAAAGHNHDASQIVSGELPDERVSDAITITGDGAVAGEAVKTGTVADVRLSSNVTLDPEVIGIVLNHDGSGSSLDADVLDGKNSSEFAAAGHNHDASQIVSGELPDERVSDAITITGDGSVAGEAVKSGTVADARLSSNVTMQGNTFNGAGQLVQLDGSGRLPAVDGSQLTGLPGGIPSGVIVMWSGSMDNIPDGWKLCDGIDGRPDLRDRFIVGASRGDADKVPVTTVKGPAMQKGGEAEHTLTIAEMPAHSHGGTMTLAGKSGDASPHDYDPHRVWPGGSSSTTGGDQAHENCPPFFALAFIIKL